MKVIKAKILDPTHSELSQPLVGYQGYVQISIPDEGEEEQNWKESAKNHFLQAYDDEDAIYDQLSFQ